MIEGMKVTVGAAELQQLCRKRADHHRERAAVYAQQVANMKEAEIEGMKYTGGDPQRALSEKQAEHASEAQEMDFIAEHLAPGEVYLLHRDDLVRLGITKSRY